LYAALDVKTGQVHGMTAARHTSRDFIAFLGGLVALTCPPLPSNIVAETDLARFCRFAFI